MSSSINLAATANGETFTHRQIYGLVLVERLGGVLSLVGVILIFIAYGLVRKVRNVQNTFIVFASISNVGASIASIIAYDGINAGEASSLCQAQSFLFEMFMQSDPWWSLAMAINVFLVFYFHTTPDSFRKWWWIYCLVCYGGPFVIALALLLVRNDPRGLIYGGATIWCWVDQDWDFIRIYTYYMLVWICIFGSFLCYFLVGWHVFRMRNRLRSFSTSRNREQKEADAPRLEGGYGTVTTEVEVIHTIKPQPAQPKRAYIARSAARVSDNRSTTEGQTPPDNQFSSSVTTAPRSQPAVTPSFLQRSAQNIQAVTNKFQIHDPIKRAYLRTSFLFALSVLATWIPSSLNRIHGWLDGQSPYQYHLATAAVLPLQGLWNSTIFFVTSWPSLMSWYRETIRGEKVGAERQRADGSMNSRKKTQSQRFDTLLDDDSTTALSEVELRSVSEAGEASTASLYRGQ